MTQTLSSGCCKTLVLVVAITVPYPTLYTLRVFYIIAITFVLYTVPAHKAVHCKVELSLVTRLVVEASSRSPQQAMAGPDSRRQQPSTR